MAPTALSRQRTLSCTLVVDVGGNLGFREQGSAKAALLPRQHRPVSRNCCRRLGRAQHSKAQQTPPGCLQHPPHSRMRQCTGQHTGFCSVAWFYLCPQIFQKNYKILKWREHRSHDFLGVYCLHCVISWQTTHIYT